VNSFEGAGDRGGDIADGACSPADEGAQGARVELRTVLKDYARVLDDVDDSPAMMWQSGFPAPRVLVRAFVLRHVVRGRRSRGACVVAIGARRIHDLELDLAALVVLALPVAAVGISCVFTDIDLRHNYFARNVPVGVVLSGVAVLAAVHLYCRARNVLLVSVGQTP
jgi:hypothetical protein